MLIHDAIKRARRNGKLVLAKPIADWAGEPRAFLMCRPLYDVLLKGRSDEDETKRRRWATLEAAMSLFVEGGFISDDLIKQLDPPKFEHWELRSRRPKPSVRVFGRFAMPDVFIGTHLEERPKLGEKWSDQFEHHKLVCEQHWNEAGLPTPFTDAPYFGMRNISLRMRKEGSECHLDLPIRRGAESREKQEQSLRKSYKGVGKSRRRKRSFA